MTESREPAPAKADEPQEQEPLIRPPGASNTRSGHASRLELFFDLAYVLVVMELAGELVHDMSWHGVGVFVGLFGATWFSWVGFTLHANRFDTDDVVFRCSKLLATMTIAGCAAGASGAIGKLAVPFAASYLAGLLVLLLMYARAWRHVPDARPTVNVYLVATAANAALWATSVATPGTTRYLLWAVGVLVGACAPLAATARRHELPLHIEHLPERFALFIILVLGETVGGAVAGLHDAAWTSAAVLLAMAGFLLAAAMWWIYFDLTETRSTNELRDEDESSQGVADGRHDAFIYAHLPLALGVVLTGVAIDDLILHPSQRFPNGPGWLLAGGICLFLAGAALVIGGTSRSWTLVGRWAVTAVPVIILAALPQASSLTLLLACGALVGAVAAYGTRKRRSNSTFA